MNNVKALFHTILNTFLFLLLPGCLLQRPTICIYPVPFITHSNGNNERAGCLRLPDCLLQLPTIFISSSLYYSQQLQRWEDWVTGAAGGGWRQAAALSLTLHHEEFPERHNSSSCCNWLKHFPQPPLENLTRFKNYCAKGWRKYVWISEINFFRTKAWHFKLSS